MKKTRGLTKKQREAVKALTRGATRGEAAQAAGVTERTVYSWLNDDGFRAALREAERAVWDATLAALRASSRVAVLYLAKVVTGQEIGDSKRIRAASILLGTAMNLIKLDEIRELEERVSKLERGERCI